MADVTTPKVTRLLKYRSMQEGLSRERTLAILETLTLHYSAASRFNDPFDCHLDIALRSTKEVKALVDKGLERASETIGGWVADASMAFRKWAQSKGATLPPPREKRPADQAQPKKRFRVAIRQQEQDGSWRSVSARNFYNEGQTKRMAEFYRRLDESFGVLCLSEPPDDILLWSHYGSSHSGLCLEFDAAAHPKIFPRLHPVRYQRKYPAIPAEFPQLLEHFLNRAKGSFDERLLDFADLLASSVDHERKTASADAIAELGLERWFYVKSSFWSYEREWRCLKWKPGPQMFPPEALTRIIVGCVDTDVTLALVRKAIEGTAIHAVPLFKTVRKARRFGLDIVPA